MVVAATCIACHQLVLAFHFGVGLSQEPMDGSTSDTGGQVTPAEVAEGSAADCTAAPTQDTAGSTAGDSMVPATEDTEQPSEATPAKRKSFLPSKTAAERKRLFSSMEWQARNLDSELWAQWEDIKNQGGQAARRKLADLFKDIAAFHVTLVFPGESKCCLTACTHL